jgi:hypothetical protein
MPAKLVCDALNMAIQPTWLRVQHEPQRKLLG